MCILYNIYIYTHTYMYIYIYIRIYMIYMYISYSLMKFMYNIICIQYTCTDIVAGRVKLWARVTIVCRKAKCFCSFCCCAICSCKGCDGLQVCFLGHQIITIRTLKSPCEHCHTPKAPAGPPAYEFLALLFVPPVQAKHLQSAYYFHLFPPICCLLTLGYTVI